MTRFLQGMLAGTTLVAAGSGHAALLTSLQGAPHRVVRTYADYAAATMKTKVCVL